MNIYENLIEVVGHKHMESKKDIEKYFEVTV